MRGEELLVARGRTWRCSGCGDPQFGLSEPPETGGERLCLRCRGERSAAERSAAAAAQPLDQVLAAAGVPWRFRRGWSRADWARSFGTWPEEIGAWRPRTERALLLLLGTPNGGKTGLATILLAEGIAAGRSGCWMRAQDLMDAHAVSYDAQRGGHPQAGRFSLRAAELELACRGAEVLVLDDLFASGRATPHARERMQALIAARYDEGLQTVVTTNRGVQELVEISQSLARRLMSGIAVPLDGAADRRLA